MADRRHDDRVYWRGQALPESELPLHIEADGIERFDRIMTIGVVAALAAAAIALALLPL